MKLLIRKATAKDVKILIPMAISLIKHIKKIGTDGSDFEKYLRLPKKRGMVFDKWVRKWIESPESIILIAEVDRKTAGYLISYIKKLELRHLDRIGFIEDLYLKPGYRKMGIGKRLIDDSFRWMKKMGVSHAALQVMKVNNEAHGAYEKWGFEDYYTEMRRKILGVFSLELFVELDNLFQQPDYP